MKMTVLLLTSACLSLTPVRAGERIAMHVTPTLAKAPAYMRVRTTVEADARNRSLEIVAESENYYRSSEWQLDGDRAPRTTIVDFPGLPGGRYAVRAVLKGTGRRPLASAFTQLQVLDGAERR